VDTKTKILTVKALKKIIAQQRKAGKKITFTNGCFDILHAGHISYLEAARKNDRILIVGLNSDKSVRTIKGPQRPIVAEGYRARLLAALQCVDYVTIFDEDTPYELIKALKPDILIKGADWKTEEVVGYDVVKKNGGKLELLEYVPGLSTTQIIESILEKCKRKR